LRQHLACEIGLPVLGPRQFTQALTDEELRNGQHVRGVGDVHGRKQEGLVAQLAANRIGAREPLVQALLVHVADGASALAWVKLRQGQGSQCQMPPGSRHSLAESCVHAGDAAGQLQSDTHQRPDVWAAPADAAFLVVSDPHLRRRAIFHSAAQAGCSNRAHLKCLACSARLHLPRACIRGLRISRRHSQSGPKMSSIFRISEVISLNQVGYRHFQEMMMYFICSCRKKNRSRAPYIP
jgi:hypothetical protein